MKYLKRKSQSYMLNKNPKSKNLSMDTKMHNKALNFDDNSLFDFRFL